MRRRLLCRLGRHNWQQQHTDDNEPYLACRHCEAVAVGQVGTYRGGGLPPGAIPSP